MSSLSRRSVQSILDLVENKLSCMQVIDREDAREFAVLEQARRELMSLCSAASKRAAQVVPFPNGHSDDAVTA